MAEVLVVVENVATSRQLYDGSQSRRLRLRKKIILASEGGTAFLSVLMKANVPVVLGTGLFSKVHR